MKINAVMFVGGSALALALQGCASEGPVADYGVADPYRATLYTGAPQPDVADQYAVAPLPSGEYSANGAPFELASYAGIEGARRAHALYTKEEAEALDGRCETSVKPISSESMIDIADLCDVSLETLVEYNPGIADISYSTDGAVVNIPGGLSSPKGLGAAADQFVLLDAVQPGDTLEKIAFRLNVSTEALANLNPGVDWTKPTPGQAFVKPASAPAPSKPAASAAPAPKWEGYSNAHGIAAGAASTGVTALAPYELRPVKSYGRASGAYPDDRLVVDRMVVKAGDAVKVTAKATPGAEVTFYAGEEPGDLKRSKTVRADEAGEATASIRVKKKANMGGVVFGAREAGSSETQYSERVGVLNFGSSKSSSSDDEDGETEE